MKIELELPDPYWRSELQKTRIRAHDKATHHPTISLLWRVLAVSPSLHNMIQSGLRWVESSGKTLVLML